MELLGRHSNRHHGSNAKGQHDEKDKKEVTTGSSKSSTHEEKDKPLFDELREFFLLLVRFPFSIFPSHPLHIPTKLARH